MSMRFESRSVKLIFIVDRDENHRNWMSPHHSIDTIDCVLYCWEKKNRIQNQKSCKIGRFGDYEIINLEAGLDLLPKQKAPNPFHNNMK